MTEKTFPKIDAVRVFPPAPKGFDAHVATTADLARHGLPLRPDARTQPELANLWDQRTRRYRHFDHLEPRLRPAGTPIRPPSASLNLPAREACGYELTSRAAPITIVSGTWTIPNLNHNPSSASPNQFRTFFGLGFLDVHVEMTVDAAQNITTAIRIHDGTQVTLPAGPGDVISAVLCQQPNQAGSAFYFLANETTYQTVNFHIDAGFSPAVSINAGISRGRVDGPPNPLARFGAVYFDEILAFATDGTKLITDGAQTVMTDAAGLTLARPLQLNDFAFKVMREPD